MLWRSMLERTLGNVAISQTVKKAKAICDVSTCRYIDKLTHTLINAATKTVYNTRLEHISGACPGLGLGGRGPFQNEISQMMILVFY